MQEELLRLAAAVEVLELAQQVQGLDGDATPSMLGSVRECAAQLRRVEIAIIALLRQNDVAWQELADHAEVMRQTLHYRLNKDVATWTTRSGIQESRDPTIKADQLREQIAHRRKLLAATVASARAGEAPR